MPKSNPVIANKFLVISLSFIVTLSWGKVVNSQTIIVAQSLLDTDYGNNYYSKMLEADRFYKQGDLQTAKKIQQEVKPDFPPPEPVPAASGDVSQLPLEAQQKWTSIQQAIAADPQEDEVIDAQIFQPLEALVDNNPQFVPGHVLLADTYDLYGYEDEALDTIEWSAEMYPGRDDVLDQRIELLLAYGKPLEASIAAREFAYSYPDFPKTPAYLTAADQYFQEYQSQLKSKVTTSTIIGGIGQTATGNEEEGLNLGTTLIEGESATGLAIANEYKSDSVMVTDTNQLQYIDTIGQKLAQLMGRDEFAYEFNIIEDPTPNAFALPGGKIFLHTGLLQLMDSEAELAGIMAHEIAHSVLSHSYKKLGESAIASTGTNLLSGLMSEDVGGLVGVGSVLLNKEFSRDKEKQADILGLRVMTAAGYSADGLYNVMTKLNQLDGESGLTDSLLATHPAPEERMKYLQELIQTKGYNRYGFEGVEKYQAVFPQQ
jgi:Zn-dependent protease with chaperone function